MIRRTTISGATPKELPPALIAGAVHAGAGAAGEAEAGATEGAGVYTGAEELGVEAATGAALIVLSEGEGDATDELATNKAGNAVAAGVHCGRPSRQTSVSGVI